MTSFRITLSPSRRAAARFVTEVTRALQKAYSEGKQEHGLSQSEIARSIGVHRSIINRQLKGHRDMSLSRVAELAYAMGKTPLFLLEDPIQVDGANTHLNSEVTSLGGEVSSNDAGATGERAQIDWNDAPEQSATRSSTQLSTQ